MSEMEGYTNGQLAVASASPARRLELNDDGMEVPLPQAMTLKEFWENPPPQPEPIIEGFLDAGTITMIVAKSKAGKSHVALKLALCIAEGKDFCQLHIPVARKSMYVNCEIKPYWLMERIRCVLRSLDPERGGNDIDNFSVVNLRDYPLQADTALQHIADEAVRLGCSVVVIDPIYLFVEGDEKDYVVMKALTDAMKEIVRKTGVALVFVHHDTKGSRPGDNAHVDRGAGSNVLGRVWDSQITLTEQESGGGVLVMECYARDRINPPPISLAIKDGCVVCSDAPPIRRTKQTDGNKGLKLSEKIEYSRGALAHIQEVLNQGMATSVSGPDVRHFLMNRFQLKEGAARNLFYELEGQSLPNGGRLKLRKTNKQHELYLES